MLSFTDAVATASNPTKSKLERETLIIFNEQEPLATLWTASLMEVKRWATLGLAIEPFGSGWRTHVGKKRIRVAKLRVILPVNSQAARDRLAKARASVGKAPAVPTALSNDSTSGPAGGGETE